MTSSNYKTAHTVVYIKRGTTGLSGELIGICDALFIGFYTAAPFAVATLPAPHSQSTPP